MKSLRHRETIAEVARVVALAEETAGTPVVCDVVVAVSVLTR
jgi:hypothetical protein